MRQPLLKQTKERGAALIMALSFFTIATFVIMELSKETLVESTLAGHSLKKLKSYYSAKAGLELALLRVKAFYEAKAALDKLGNAVPAAATQQLGAIVEFDLPWPIPLPEDANIIAKDENKKILKKTLLKGVQFFHSIQDPGSKIDINSLGSPVERISEQSIASLTRSFEQILESDEAFAREHSIDSIKEALNNIADWVDRDTQSRNGGDEQSLYPYDDQEGYPRNQSFLSFSELIMVSGVDDLIFQKLKQLTTINGSFGINVNKADKNALQGIDSQFTDEATDEFIKRRQEIFDANGELDKASFDSILSELGFSDIPEIHKGIPILYSPLSAFKIRSSGVSGEIETILEASVINAEALKEIYIEQLDEGAKEESSGSGSGAASTTPPSSGGANSNASTNKTTPVPKGKPFIIHMEVL